MSSPVPEVDYTATVQRPSWTQLPHAVRRAVGAAAGSPVASADDPPGSGFTGSFAAVVHLVDGRSVFAKAGSGRNPHVLEALAQEATVLAVLPTGVPAPRLVGSLGLDPGVADAYAWRVLVVEVVPGRVPAPWTHAVVGAVHEACVQAAAALTPAPPGLVLASLGADLLADERSTGLFDRLASGAATVTWGQPHWVLERASELSALARAAPSAVQGSTACHGDLRADNVLVDGDRAMLVDWNWLARGAPWTDFVGVLPLARADGVDVDAWVRRSPLTREVPADDIDAFLAWVAAYMLAGADDPPWPGGSALIRVHQRRFARTFLDWLAARRGWLPQ